MVARGLELACHGVVWAATVALAMWATGASAAVRHDSATPHTPPYTKYKYIPLRPNYDRYDSDDLTWSPPSDPPSTGGTAPSDPPSTGSMAPSEFILTALRTALDVVRNINKQRALAQPKNNTAVVVRPNYDPDDLTWSPPSDPPSTGGTAPSDPPSTGGMAPSDPPSTGGMAPSDPPSTGGTAPSDPPSTGGMPPSEFILTALRTALDVVRNINKQRALAQPNNNTATLRRTRVKNGTSLESGRGFEDYYDEHHDHETTTTTAKPMKQGRYTDPWAGYYDWIINEGSFKFWSVFQLFTAAVLLYACLSAIYYAKFNPILPDYDREYDDYFLERTVGRQARSLDSMDSWELPSGLSWINPRTFQFILDAIATHYEQE